MKHDLSRFSFSSAWPRFAPLAFFLENRNRAVAARLTLVFESLVGTYVTALGVQTNVFADLYYLAILVLPLVVFDLSERKYVIAAQALIPVFWGLETWGPLPSLSTYWIPENFPSQPFVTLNALGTPLIMIIILDIYTKTLHSVKNTLNTVIQRFEETQRLAKLGGWEFDLVTKQMNWSNQVFNPFKRQPEQGPMSFGELAEIINSDDRPAWLEGLHRSLNDGSPFTTRFKTNCAYGCIWIEASVYGSFDDEGTLTGLAGFFRDVTVEINTKKKLEEEKLKNLRVSKLASLGEMSAGMAHEINNPLGVIDLLAGQLPRNLGEPGLLAEKVAGIQRSVRRIAKIVNGLKRYSRTGDKPELKRQQLPQILREAISLTEVKAKSNGTVLTLEGDSDAVIYCDEIEIEQVAINLINNAIDAIKHRKERWVRMTVTNQPSQIILHIVDSGEGISEEVRHKLFEPFFTTKKTGEGTGLGLSICKGILDDHRATIDVVASYPNTCFEIAFPKPAADENQQDNAA